MPSPFAAYCHVATACFNGVCYPDAHTLPNIDSQEPNTTCQQCGCVLNSFREWLKHSRGHIPEAYLPVFIQLADGGSLHASVVREVEPKGWRDLIGSVGIGSREDERRALGLGASRGRSRRTELGDGSRRRCRSEQQGHLGSANQAQDTRRRVRCHGGPAT